MIKLNLPGRSRRPFWIALSLLLVSLFAVAAFWLWPMLYPPPDRIAETAPGCDLHAGACTARVADGGTVRLMIEPRAVPVMTPLQLGVETSGLAVQTVEVDFVGVEMNMGFNRVALTRTGTDRYTGQGTLPACAHGRMTWEARVLIQTPQGLLAAPFRFETER